MTILYNIKKLNNFYNKMDLQRDFENGFREETKKWFKEVHNEAICEYVQKEEELDNIVDLIYESDYNYKHADPTTRQTIFSHSEIEELLKEIKKENK